MSKCWDINEILDPCMNATPHFVIPTSNISDQLAIILLTPADSAYLEWNDSKNQL